MGEATTRKKREKTGKKKTKKKNDGVGPATNSWVKPSREEGVFSQGGSEEEQNTSPLIENCSRKNEIGSSVAGHQD